MKNTAKWLLGLGCIFAFAACEPQQIDCNPTNEIDTSRGACDQTLSFTPSVSITVNGPSRNITTNCIPNHMVGKFGGGSGSLNPNAISPVTRNFGLSTNPQMASSITYLLGNRGPDYAFGVLLNGIELDPIAAEPWPHTTPMDPNVNWTWNLEATNVRIGLDCNDSHVQPTGKYHCHGLPTLYIDALNPSPTAMTLIGWAADGYPIYYQYGYSDATDNTSTVKTLSSSYRLKQGERPGTGIDGPCGTYNGIYSNDYEYVSGLGDLDECNGRTGVTPDFPSGTYYYVLTNSFPFIPRCFKGTPSADFSF